MTPSEKCVSLETAKRLLAVGFPQDTERAWRWQFDDQYELGYPNSAATKDYAAPDSQEIGELLPHSVDTKEGSWIITMPNLNGFRYLDYIKYSSNGVGTLLHGYPLLSGKNEAEARAACWLWLKEQGLI